MTNMGEVGDQLRYELETTERAAIEGVAAVVTALQHFEERVVALAGEQGEQVDMVRGCVGAGVAQALGLHGVLGNIRHATGDLLEAWGMGAESTPTPGGVTLPTASGGTGSGKRVAETSPRNDSPEF